MNSLTLGTATSQTEVANISAFGIWLLVGNEELFLPYDEFPWFKDQTVRAILNDAEVRASLIRPSAELPESGLGELLQN